MKKQKIQTSLSSFFKSSTSDSIDSGKIDYQEVKDASASNQALMLSDSAIVPSIDAIIPIENSMLKLTCNSGERYSWLEDITDKNGNSPGKFF